MKAKQLMVEGNRKLVRKGGVLVVTLCTLLAAALAPDAPAPVGEALTEIKKGQEATSKELSEIRRGQALTNEMINELRKDVAQLHPGANSVRPLPEPLGASDQITLATGKMSLRLTLVSADDKTWVYRIDSFDYEGESSIHDRGSMIMVTAGKLVGLLAGKDYCLVASVIQLESGRKVPWVGLVPAKNRPGALWVLPVTLL